MDAFTIVDVGARWGAADKWASLGPDVRVFGFDPDPDECDRLNRAARASGDRSTTYVAAALGDAIGRRALHITEEPACSSIYPPRRDLATSIPELACIAPRATVDVDMTTLDAWCREADVDRVDALKLDTQGSELDVLRGAVRTLEDVLVIESEVEFNPIYEGQPLFGDVDAFLRSHGFVLWRLEHLVHYSPRPGHLAGGSSLAYFDSRPVVADMPGGQLFWGHAWFVAGRLVAPGAAADERASRLALAAGLGDLASLLAPS